jgi:mono/diheme cytochrome c family protein
MKKQLTLSAILVVSLALLLLFQNCGKPSELTYMSSVDLSTQEGVQMAAGQILEKKCAECHNPNNINGNVSNITDPDYLVYTRLVVPGEPEISPLVIQITKGLMPKDGDFLTPQEVDIIKAWIISLDPQTLSPGGDLVQIPLAPTYRSLAANIFAPKCAACHSSGAGSATNARFGTYEGVFAVRAQLRNRIRGLGGVQKMPQAPNPELTEPEKQAIEAWVAAGAPNN